MTVKELKQKLDDLLFVKEEYDEDEIEYDIDDVEFDDEPYFQPYYKTNIIEIVLTGGPCSGKSELLRLASDTLKEKGIPVFLVNETATELLQGNLVFSDDPLAFQQAVCSLQLAKEKTMLEYVMSYLRGKNLVNAVIIYDRSAWDGRAYLDDEEWIRKVFRKYGVYSNLGSRFVIHLESAAVVGRFSKDNNEERYENAEIAAKLDKRLFDLYRSHPFFAHIPAREDFEQKKEEFLRVLLEFVGKKLVSEKEEENS